MAIVNEWFYCFKQPALGTPLRKVFTVKETHKGDVFIVPTVISYTPELIPEDATSETHPQKETKEYRWTIHPSLDSPNGINVINKHLFQKGEERELFRLVTHVIKDKSGFQPIFGRRCPDFKNPKCDVSPETANTVTLATFDHRHFHATIQVFVSHRELSFELPENAPDISVMQFVINDFRFVILMSFYPFCATDRGALFDVETEDLGPEYDGKYGHPLSASQAVDWFRTVYLSGLKDLQEQFPKAIAHPEFGPMLQCGVFLGCPNISDIHLRGRIIMLPRVREASAG